MIKTVFCLLCLLIVIANPLFAVESEMQVFRDKPRKDVRDMEEALHDFMEGASAGNPLAVGINPDAKRIKAIKIVTFYYQTLKDGQPGEVEGPTAMLVFKDDGCAIFSVMLMEEGDDYVVTVPKNGKGSFIPNKDKLPVNEFVEAVLENIK